MKIIALDYLWWGVCVGGKHYTGKVTFYEDDNHSNSFKSVELERKLSAKEAKQLAEDCGRLWGVRETATNKFDTLEQLEQAAIKWCKENIEDEDWLLQEHNTYGIRRPIYGHGKFEAIVPLLSLIESAWDKIDDQYRTDAVIMSFRDLWKTTLKIAEYQEK